MYTASIAMIKQDSYFKACVTKTDSLDKGQDAYTRIAEICGDSLYVCTIWQWMVEKYQDM